MTLCKFDDAIYWFQPIRIDTLPGTKTLLEDIDKAELLHQIYTYDYNFADQDTVTCILSSNPDPTLIELKDDGNNNYDCNYYNYYSRILMVWTSLEMCSK